ncbi:hypothetical protein EX895_004552 [Sporisorium graminicola]|uniref:Uncharacterized protein n=1 Tax=Sporisorium graminicola TaxID=280036 RepID=A0A4U7KQ57_9BASI|nr:hypothetical protein EX895_004552 [Sporisorium graminicola]TKY86403.1 hypothetical protein EX895_004552 [Sporisorium graminicola]
MTSAHPVLTLINRCDALAQQFDTTFAASCKLLTDVANGNISPSGPQTMDEALMALRDTLETCEATVSQMQGCVWEDIPHLLNQLDSGGEAGVGNWNPRQALTDISELFYSYSDLLLKRRELLADFTCEEISPAEFVRSWTNIDSNLAMQRKQQVDDLADLLAAF